MSDKQDELRPIIIKKVKKVAGGHHGGAWKVAYADFVTAMMAFFLLLWLLNVTTKEQKEGIAEYFDPTPMVSKSDDGAGGLLGGLTVSPEGAMISQKEPVPRLRRTFLLSEQAAIRRTPSTIPQRSRKKNFARKSKSARMRNSKKRKAPSIRPFRERRTFRTWPKIS